MLAGEGTGEEVPGSEGVMSKMETGESLGHGSVCSTCAGSFPRGSTPWKIPGCCENAEEEFIYLFIYLKNF